MNVDDNEPSVFERIDKENSGVVGGKVEAVPAKQLRCLIFLMHGTAIV